MKQLQVKTSSKRQVLDITDLVETELPVGEGVATVFAPHTTVGITTADLDPGTDEDLLEFLESLVPDKNWRHPHDPAHAPDHLLSSLIGPSVSVPYSDGKLMLGTWQRIILVELDGPRDRHIIVSF
jgi:secondary thiamine-phosphate synthase enzyme